MLQDRCYSSSSEPCIHTFANHFSFESYFGEIPYNQRGNHTSLQRSSIYYGTPQWDCPARSKRLSQGFLSPGHNAYRQLLRTGGYYFDACYCGLLSLITCIPRAAFPHPASVACRRCYQYSVHIGNDICSQSGMSNPSQYLEQWILSRPRYGAFGKWHYLLSASALSLFWASARAFGSYDTWLVFYNDAWMKSLFLSDIQGLPSSYLRKASMLERLWNQSQIIMQQFYMGCLQCL